MTRTLRSRQWAGLCAAVRPAASARAVLIAVGLTLVLAVVCGFPVVRAAHASTRTLADAQGSVQIRIDDVSPSVVPRSTTPQALQIRVSLTNTTGSALNDVRVLGFRGEPIGNQKALDAAMAQQTAPSDGYPITAKSPLHVTLPANATVTATFVTTISILNDDSGLCQCLNAIYPIYLVASLPAASGADGAGTTLGSAATYLPSQVHSNTKVRVSWVWPLIDRPHRLASETTFFDDDLGASVSGGRLDRALQVVEGLDAATPITLMIDPELLDELEVMASGKYTVQAVGSTSKPVTGAGAEAAQAWLARLAAVLNRGNVQISLTPYADPDLQALTGAGISWSSALPADMATRVSTALAGHAVSTDIAWPAGGSVDSTTLSALAASGVTTAVLDSSDVSPATRDTVPVAVTKIRTSAGTVAVTATSPAMQRLAATAVEPGQVSASGADALPYLIAEIAVRAVQSDNGDGGDTNAVLTPPRYVDPDPQQAIRVIQDTSTNAYATAVPLRSLSSAAPSSAAKLRSRASATSTVRVPTANLAAAEHTSHALPTLSSMLGRDSAATPAVTGLARAEQRIVSSAWRQTQQSPFEASLGPLLASTLDHRVTHLLGGVRIVTPEGTSYTLGSNDSSLPVTVENTLPYTVQIRVAVTSVDGLPGYRGDTKTPSIAAGAKQTVQVPSHLERSGRIRVDAKITTPSGRDLGRPVLLYVRSTEFGAIGIVITLVAGAVLVLALCVRFGRRLQRLSRTSRTSAGDSATSPHATAARPASPSRPL